MNGRAIGPLLVLCIFVNNGPVLAHQLMQVPVARRMVPAPPGLPDMRPDQVNVAGWDKAWTNLVNDAEQRFIPSMPRLAAVEVELLVGNPGSSQDDLTLTVLNQQGDELVSVTQEVQTSNCQHIVFVLPNGGIDVNPGSTYRVRVKGGIIFGWKYVIGGYSKGEATFNGKPLVPKARSTFLFRTFGSE